MRIRLCIALLATLMLLHHLSAQDQAKPLTNDDVVKMVKSGMDEGLIKTVIQRSLATKFNTSPDALISLKNAGVPATMVTGPAPTSIASPLAARPTSDKVKEPEYADSAFLLDSSGSLKPLERQTAHSNIKMKVLVNKHAKRSMIYGAKSPVRISADQKPEFVIRPSARDVDPSTVIQFFSLKTNKDNREFQMDITRTFSKPTAKVPFSVVKYGISSFKITPTGTLPPGEYVISTTTTEQGYCFGVD